MLWWKVVSGGGDNWSALPMGAAVIGTGVTVQPVCKLKCAGCPPAAKKEGRAELMAALFGVSPGLLLFGALTKKQIRNAEQPGFFFPFFLKRREEHFEMMITAFGVSLKTSKFILVCIKKSELEHFCGRKRYSPIGTSAMWASATFYVLDFHFISKILYIPLLGWCCVYMLCCVVICSVFCFCIFEFLP